MAGYIGSAPHGAIIGGTTLSDRLYLDHAATTPILPEAREAMAKGLAMWANPSSPHAEGRAARAALEQAREQVAAAYGWSHEVIFTGGATESIRMALRRAQAGQRRKGLSLPGARQSASSGIHQPVFSRAPPASGVSQGVSEVTIAQPPSPSVRPWACGKANATCGTCSTVRTMPMSRRTRPGRSSSGTAPPPGPSWHLARSPATQPSRPRD